jgi:hypothetical protein
MNLNIEEQFTTTHNDIGTGATGQSHIPRRSGTPQISKWNKPGDQ